MTAGYGPASEHDLSSDKATVENAKQFYRTLFPRLKRLGIDSRGDGLNSYWPVDYSKPVDKKETGKTV